MPRSILKRELNLKGLELFQITAEKGSLRAAAKETGLTISTVSHHLKTLEESLGVELFDHARRPMVLTPKGSLFLRSIDEALFIIRKAKAEASAGDLTEASLLRIGAIEDFDSDIIPELAVSLSKHMPACEFSYQSESSHMIIDMLRNRRLDLGITSIPHDHLRGLKDRPLLRDPFVVVVPRGLTRPLSDIVEGRGDLSFLRFSSNLLIGQQIETQLRRLDLTPNSHFECSNDRTLMAMVAAGAGWTITTPLLFARAKRFQSKLEMHKFPGRGFSRTLSIVSTHDCSQSVLDLIDGKMRALVTKYAITPQTRDQAWLSASFELLG